VNNFFNSSISSGGVNVPGRIPGFVNQLGFDLDGLDLPEGAIPNNANGAEACLGTVGDTYFFGGIAFDVLIRAPNVHIAKSADRSQAAPGDVVTYTTSVTNPTRGPDDPLYPTPTVPATNLVVVDVLPSGLDFDGFVTNPGGVCAYVTAVRAIRCAVGTLGIDDTFGYTYQARVSGAAQGEQPAPLVNAACYASNSEDQPDTEFSGCDEATVVVPGAPYVDLGVVKSVSDDVVQPGSTLTWHVTGTNHGPGASTNFVLVDELPADVTFVSYTASAALTCTTPAVGATGAVTCTAPLVQAGTSLGLTIVGTVPSTAADGALLLNVATVSGDQSEPVPDPHPNRDTATTTVFVPDLPIPPTPTPTPDPDPDGPIQPPQPPPTPPFVPPGRAGTRLRLQKRPDVRQARRGDTVTYTLRVTNTGEASAQKVRVCDAPQTGLSFLSTPGFQRVGSRACITIGTIGVRKHVTLTLTGRVTENAASFVFNRASAQARNAPRKLAGATVRVIGGTGCPSSRSGGALAPTTSPHC
jgi:uncharacterized repeat protein (TIGR01451 family)